MNLHNLKPNPGAKHRKKRLGCGESSGLGKTSGRDHKGQKSRSGGGVRPGFEGGQMPLARRLPKRGFSNLQFRDTIAIVNVSQLEQYFEAGAEVNEETLRQVKLVKGQCDKVKVLGQGEITKSLKVTVDQASTSAKEKIEKAGGSLELGSCEVAAPAKAPAKAEAPAKEEAPSAEAEAPQDMGRVFETAPDQVDDLKVISGVGPGIEEKLNGFGVYTYAQIAEWDAANVETFDTLLSFKGRIDRDNWIEQAKELAAKG